MLEIKVSLFLTNGARVCSPELIGNGDPRRRNDAGSAENLLCLHLEALCRGQKSHLMGSQSAWSAWADSPPQKTQRGREAAQALQARTGDRRNSGMLAGRLGPGPQICLWEGRGSSVETAQGRACLCCLLHGLMVGRPPRLPHAKLEPAFQVLPGSPLCHFSLMVCLPGSGLEGTGRSHTNNWKRAAIAGATEQKELLCASVAGGQGSAWGSVTLQAALDLRSEG